MKANATVAISIALFICQAPNKSQLVSSIREDDIVAKVHPWRYSEHTTFWSFSVSQGHTWP